MQELPVDKIYFIEFLSISDKARLDQLKIVTAACSTSLSESFQAYPWQTKNGKYPVLRTCLKSHQLNQTPILLPYSISCFPYIFVRILPKWSTTRYLKAEVLQLSQKYELCRFNSFCPEFTFWYICAQGARPHNFIWLFLEQAIIFRGAFNKRN